jgi:hypothetical protein
MLNSWCYEVFQKLSALLEKTVFSKSYELHFLKHALAIIVLRKLSFTCVEVE